MNDRFYHDDFNMYSEQLLLGFCDKSGLLDAISSLSLKESKSFHYGYGFVTVSQGNVVLENHTLLHNGKGFGFTAFSSIEKPMPDCFPIFAYSFPPDIKEDVKNELSISDNRWIQSFMNDYKDIGIEQALFFKTDGKDGKLALCVCNDSFFAFQSIPWPFEKDDCSDYGSFMDSISRNEYLNALNELDRNMLYHYYSSMGNITNKELAAKIGETEVYVKNHLRFLYERIPSVSNRSSLLGFLSDLIDS